MATNTETDLQLRGSTETEQIDAELDLDELIGQLEGVDWRLVPDVSAVTAATFTKKLRLARDDLQEGV